MEGFQSIVEMIIEIFFDTLLLPGDVFVPMDLVPPELVSVFTLVYAIKPKEKTHCTA